MILTGHWLLWLIAKTALAAVLAAILMIGYIYTKTQDDRIRRH